MNSAIQKNNQNSLKEKGKLYFESLAPLFTEYSQMYEQPGHNEEWNQYQKEFHVIVRELGIKPSDFEQATSADLKRFLVTYYLIAESRAPDYVIDYTYNSIVETSFELLMSELGEIVQGVGQISKDIEFILRSIFISNSGSDHVRAGLSIPQISMVKSGLLRFLICRGKIHSHKVAAILGTPYAPYVNCEPEEFLAYLFGLKRKEGFPMLRQVLVALLEKIRTTDKQQGMQPLVQSAA
jgi:hypothetical protein